jgi:Zn-finger nucleic acid-binding protein
MPDLGLRRFLDFSGDGLVTDTRIHRGAYNCPNCGAGASPEAVRCAYCHSGLATQVCFSCFGAIAWGMKHCPSCGAPAANGRPDENASRRCPRCEAEFLHVEIRARKLSECPVCGGLWVDQDTFQQICTDQEQQEAVMNILLGPPQASTDAPGKTQRLYIPCPECGKLMNRRHFAGCSGIIVDWCKNHGTWFDREELKQVVQFIQAGGLRKSREKEKSRLEEEKEHLKEENRNLTRIARLAGDSTS